MVIDSRYVPPEFRVFETCGDEDEQPGRYFVHFDGQLGQPATALILGSEDRDGHRVAVETSGPSNPHSAGWDRVAAGWNRVVAVARLRDLAGLGLPPGAWEELSSACEDKERWSPCYLQVEAVRTDAMTFMVEEDLWVVLAETETRLQLAVYGRGAPKAPVHVRAVRDWSPYGIDLSRPCELSSLPMAATVSNGGFL